MSDFTSEGLSGLFPGDNSGRFSTKPANVYVGPHETLSADGQLQNWATPNGNMTWEKRRIRKEGGGVTNTISLTEEEKKSINQPRCVHH